MAQKAPKATNGLSIPPIKSPNRPKLLLFEKALEYQNAFQNLECMLTIRVWQKQ